MELLDLLKKYEKGNLSFKESVSLFFTLYPDKKSSLAVLMESDDQFSRARLNKGLIAKLKELEENVSRNAFTETLETSMPKIDPSVLPPDLRELYFQIHPMIRKITAMHQRLTLVDDRTRYTLAAEIIRLGDQRSRNYELIDHYIKTGINLNQVAETPVDPAEIFDKTKAKNFEVEYKIKLLRSRISKCKENDVILPHKKDLHDKLVNELSELKKQRNG